MRAGRVLRRRSGRTRAGRTGGPRRGRRACCRPCPSRPPPSPAAACAAVTSGSTPSASGAELRTRPSAPAGGRRRRDRTPRGEERGPVVVGLAAPARARACAGRFAEVEALGHATVGCSRSQCAAENDMPRWTEPAGAAGRKNDTADARGSTGGPAERQVAVGRGRRGCGRAGSSRWSGRSLWIATIERSGLGASRGLRSRCAPP